LKWFDFDWFRPFVPVSVRQLQISFADSDDHSPLREHSRSMRDAEPTLPTKPIGFRCLLAVPAMTEPAIPP
jgi:hypothetical protein